MTKVYGIKDPQYGNPTAVFQDNFGNWFIIGTDGGTYNIDQEYALTAIIKAREE